MCEKFPNLEYSVNYADDYSQGFCAAPHFKKQEDEDGGGGAI
jgi:hypothetical protein